MLDTRCLILDAGQWYSVNNDSFAVIPAKAGIQIFVILSEAKDLALGDKNYVAAKRRKKAVEVFL